MITIQNNSSAPVTVETLYAADPGTAWVDTDGDVWIRTDEGMCMISSSSGRAYHQADDLAAIPHQLRPVRITVVVDNG